MILACSVALTVIIVLLCISARKVKLPIKHRVLHIRYVIFTVLFSITGVALFGKILNLINTIMSIPFIKGILFFVIPQSNVSAGFYWIITLFSCIFFMTVYSASMGLMRRLWLYPLSKKKYLSSKSIVEKAFNYIAGLFYEIIDNRAVLPPKKINVGQWIRIMRIAFGVIFLVESLFIGVNLQFGFTFFMPNTLASFVKSLYMIPVLSYIILEQIELFFSADIKKGERLIDTEEINSHIQGDFSKLVSLYEEIFGGKSLIKHYTGNGRNTVKRELISGVQEEQKARVQNPALLEALCRNVRNISELSSHRINELIDLINGRSIAVYASIWSEFDVYYLAYIQHWLNLGKTTLVICKTEQEVNLIKKRYSFVFKKMNVISTVWRIRDISTAVDGKTDVLVCTEKQLMDDDIYIQFPEFYSSLKNVVVLDSYGLLCRDESYFDRVFCAFSEKDVQFIFYVPENNTDIRNELQARINDNTIGLCECPYINDNTNILLWRSESIYKPQVRISERLYHDFGTAYTIAIIAAGQDVPSVSILASDSVPIETYNSLVTKEYSRVLMEDYLKNGSINLSSVIQNNSYQLSSSRLPFNIVYDDRNNLLNVVKVWLAYSGAETSMLNIISAPYMLRDYFACNIDTLCVESTGLQLIIPGKSLHLRAPVLAILLRMRKGVCFEELFEFVKDYGIDCLEIEQIINSLLTIVFGDNNQYSVYNCFSFKECKNPDFENDNFIYRNSVKMIDDDLYFRISAMTEDYVRLDGAISSVLPINVNDVYNYFLPNQNASFGGIRYSVKGISDGVVYLIAEETIDMEERYTSLFNITEFEKLQDYRGHAVSTEKISTEFFEAKVTRKITSYYSYPGALLFNGKSTTLVELPQPVAETKKVPCLHITLKCPLHNCSEKVANTVCYLFNGAMETFLPENYKDILVFSKINKENICVGVNFETASDLLPDPIPSDYLTGFEDFERINPDILRIIPEVAGDDLLDNTDENIHLYVVHFSESDTGIITAIARELERILLTLFKYLNWVEAQDETMASYIRFGYKKTPGIFDTVATLMCLSRVLPKTPEQTEQESIQNVIEHYDGDRCSFCGKSTMVVKYPMDENRIMCVDCHNHITTSREEVRVLLKNAIKLLENHYDITIPAKISVKFRSASAIRKALNNDGSRRILGFFDPKKNEIQVERGGPEPCTVSTLIHELTHAWQFANLDVKNIELKYIEGHTAYVEVECLRLMKQNAFADFYEDALLLDQTVYGEGYRFWKNYLCHENNKNIFTNIKEMF